ncbi:hypothetical protein K438DRAFT_514060 [Mycena galopus ATCC 62051]|nr:hypothetical protein K438DRAFT_514060 [Mycena galopus ATCC 62051]
MYRPSRAVSLRRRLAPYCSSSTGAIDSNATLLRPHFKFYFCPACVLDFADIFSFSNIGILAPPPIIIWFEPFADCYQCWIDHSALSEAPFFLSAMSNIFDVQELIDYCLDFLDLKSDLKTCALVHRTWVYAAQSRLFVNLDICNSVVNQHLRIQQLPEICRSPRILTLVLRLEIDLHYLGSTSFSASIKQFTRLKEVRLSGNSVDSTRETAMQAIHALFGISTVERAEMCCTFPSPSDFLRI